MSVPVPPAGLRLAIGQVAQAVYPPGATFGPRTLGDYEFVWILEGDVAWEVDGVRVPAPAGTLLLGRPGMRDAFAWDPRRSTRHGFVHFRLLARGALPDEARWPLARRLADGDIARPLLRHLAWLQSHRPAGWEALAQSALAHVLIAYIADATGTVGEEVPGLSPVVDRVLEEVRRAWASGRLTQFPLARLCRIAGVSRGHLIRVFTAQLGVGPGEALRALRLDRAAVLLARSNLQVQEVAAQCGFGDAFHFSRLFRGAYGHSPRAFRQRCVEGMPVPAIPLHRVHALSQRVWR